MKGYVYYLLPYLGVLVGMAATFLVSAGLGVMLIVAL